MLLIFWSVDVGTLFLFLSLMEFKMLMFFWIFFLWSYKYIYYNLMVFVL